jgi:hypothetical protein|uniref:Uncharacterized protein n=1 Tax=Zea mays TaxID=4577 RepID=C0P967_MAIZE|nr:unknown [Zea mays]
MAKGLRARNCLVEVGTEEIIAPVICVLPLRHCKSKWIMCREIIFMSNNLELGWKCWMPPGDMRLVCWPRCVKSAFEPKLAHLCTAE